MKKEVNLKNVRGSYDYLKEEQKIRNYIQDTLRNTFEKFGYQPIETPILCYFDLLAGKYDESNDLLNEIYKLTDRGERKLGLRYDLTVPFAKCIAMTKDLRMPFKRYEIGKVFRDGPVKLGRDREFLQCDVDVVGISGQLIEAELISVWLSGYTALGIESYVKYNSRNLMRGLIKEQGIKEENIDRVVTVIDKIDKLSESDFIKELISVGVNNEQADNLLNYFKQDFETLENLFKNTENELLKKGLEELSELKKILTEIGLENDTIFSPSLARGQDYYTGNVFEAYAKNGELTGSIGGGGRYDKMITDFIDDGKEYPAVGVSFGLSSIYEILRRKEEFKNESLIDIYVIPMGTEASCLKISNELRNLGYKVDIEMNKRKIKKCFEFANKENIPYVIVIGENEVLENKFKLKDMKTGNEVEIDMDNISKVKDILD